ncbi:ABC transporter permease [Massilia sp. TWP1-3-3]|uniref:ABC transporter permease n=1 Tax=Massilia sp. TWP1-3-3 TaxID=2804573 RepID=UPI003CE71771
MFKYYFMLGLRSLRRNPALTALMVLTLAIGVAASVSTLTILHVMSGDPIPHKSERLFVPQFDVGPLKGYIPGEEAGDRQMTYPDAVNLLRAKVGERRTAMFGISAPIEPQRKDLGVFPANGLALTRDFFAMFDVPFLHGQAWSEDDDAAGVNVVVLSRQIAGKLFGQANPVGQRIIMLGQPFQVAGVLNDFAPLPHYYRLIGGEGNFGNDEDVYIPFATAARLKSSPQGSMNCSATPGPGYEGLLASECTFIQFWFETKTARERTELQAYLANYSADQRKLGRHQRAVAPSLYDVNEWLVFMKVVGNDNKLSAWLASGFLVLCLVNTVGLLLAKFSVRAAEVGIRRALGASRQHIFRQFLVETAVIGLAGGILGLLLAIAALALISMQSSEMGSGAHMDWVMLGFTFVLSVGAAVVAGLLPTWRACQVTPAMQLKSQ